MEPTIRGPIVYAVTFVDGHRLEIEGFPIQKAIDQAMNIRMQTLPANEVTLPTVVAYRLQIASVRRVINVTVAGRVTCQLIG